jgi:hypothetical protein
MYTINGDAYEEFVEWRKREKKKPVGPIAQKKHFALLSQYPHDVQQEIVDRSINSGWQGLFPPRGGDNGRPGSRSSYPRQPASVSISSLADAGDEHGGRAESQLPRGRGNDRADAGEARAGVHQGHQIYLGLTE